MHSSNTNSNSNSYQYHNQQQHSSRIATTSSPSLSDDDGGDAQEDDLDAAVADGSPTTTAAAAAAPLLPEPSPAPSASSQPSLGHPAAAAVEVFNGQPKRTRASKACDVCRKKRTKCSGGLPCAGCAAFDFHCSYTETTKRRGPVRKNTIKTLESRLKMMESLLASGGDEDEGQEGGDNATTTTNANANANAGDADEASANAVARVRPRDEGASRRGSLAKRPKVENTGSMLVMDVGASFVMWYGRSAWAVHQSPRYQDGVLTLPFRIPSAVVNPSSPMHLVALRQVLPFTHEQIMILAKRYFHVIHPFLPIVDRGVFFRTLAEGPDSHPFRALLYSILIVASQQAGEFEVTAEATADMGEKLHQILVGYEAPHCWIVQSLLLLALTNQLASDKPEKPIITSKWRLAGLAVRYAQELGLHRNLHDIKRPVESGSGVTEETRRRTWFACYVLDRCTAVVTGRPCCIHDDDWDTPLPTGFSELEEERLDLEYFVKYIELIEIMGMMLKKVNSARGIWGRRGKTNKAEGGAEIVADLRTRLDRWLESLPAFLRLDPNPDGMQHWTRRELLHATWHTIILLSRRALLGTYDAECSKSTAALVGILETLKNGTESPLPPSIAKPPGMPSPPPPPTPQSADQPNFLARPHRHYLFPGTAITFFTTWDALLTQHLAGDEEALPRMDRIHSLMETLASEHPVFLVSLGLMADSLEAKGIHSSLTAWASNARRARAMWGAGGGRYPGDSPMTTGDEDIDGLGDLDDEQRAPWIVDPPAVVAGATTNTFLRDQQSGILGMGGGGGGGAPLQQPQLQPGMWSSPSPTPPGGGPGGAGFGMNPVPPYQQQQQQTAIQNQAPILSYPPVLRGSSRMLPPSGVHTTTAHRQQQQHQQQQHLSQMPGIYPATGMPQLPQHQQQQHPSQLPVYLTAASMGYPSLDPSLGTPGGYVPPPPVVPRRAHVNQEDDFLSAMFGDLEDTAVWDLMGFV
ncbi:fungal-specific transcription factor domain-containing protein [Geranomyces variabilis]|nr:fungal-specific transcription factor domain-containing protein [Geranomyces variabilis]KAJ3135066.1 hypothetical protein HDU90_004094 [Geranomyces variabilis]